MHEMKEVGRVGSVLRMTPRFQSWHWGTQRSTLLLRDQSLGERKTKRLNSVELEMLVNEQMEILMCKLESRSRVRRTGVEHSGGI